VTIFFFFFFFYSLRRAFFRLRLSLFPLLLSCAFVLFYKYKDSKPRCVGNKN